MNLIVHSVKILSLNLHIQCSCVEFSINSLSANPTKWSKTLKQFVGNLPTNCLSMFDHFVILALKELRGNKEQIKHLIPKVFI